MWIAVRRTEVGSPPLKGEAVQGRLGNVFCLEDPWQYGQVGLSPVDQVASVL